jgi:hypothetical protein
MKLGYDLPICQKQFTEFSDRRRGFESYTEFEYLCAYLIITYHTTYSHYPKHLGFCYGLVLRIDKSRIQNPEVWFPGTEQIWEMHSPYEMRLPQDA